MLMNRLLLAGLAAALLLFAVSRWLGGDAALIGPSAPPPAPPDRVPELRSGIGTEGASRTELIGPEAASVAGPSGLDWTRFPRGLAAHASEAIDTSNGEMASQVASALLRCKFVERDMASYRDNLGKVQQVPIRKALEADYQELQRMASQCQTVPGDVGALRRQTLEVAERQGIVGAALELFGEGVRSAELGGKVVADARRGHLGSLAIAASGNPSDFSLTQAEAQVLRYALVLAAQDPQLKTTASGYLDMAQRFNAIDAHMSQPSKSNAAAAMESWRGVGAGKPFDQSQVDEATRQAAEQILVQLRARYRQP
jgi:hypothetical protein